MLFHLIQAPILHGRISLKKANMELSIQNPDKWKKRLQGREHYYYDVCVGDVVLYIDFFPIEW